MKFNLKQLCRNAGRVIDKYSPEILIGCGLVGFATTCMLVAHEAPIAKEELDDLHAKLGESDEEISKAKIIFEEAKTVLPIYAPSIISGVMSCGCILGSYRISSKRTAALATAYEFANSSLIEYQNKVVEKLGEKKEKEIRHEISEDKIKKNPPPEDYKSSYGGINGGKEEVYTDGLYLFYDNYTGRYLRSNSEIIAKAEKRITERLFTEMWVSLNEFYWELGVGPTDAGDDFGFNVDDGIDIDISESTKLPDGTTVTIMKYTPNIRMF